MRRGYNNRNYLQFFSPIEQNGPINNDISSGVRTKTEIAPSCGITSKAPKQTQYDVKSQKNYTIYLCLCLFMFGRGSVTGTAIRNEELRQDAMAAFHKARTRPG